MIHQSLQSPSPSASGHSPEVPHSSSNKSPDSSSPLSVSLHPDEVSFALTSSRFLIVCPVVVCSRPHSSSCFPDIAPCVSLTQLLPSHELAHRIRHSSPLPLSLSVSHSSVYTPTLPTPCRTRLPHWLLPPKATFLYKAFYPSGLKNFTLGSPPKAIFPCVTNPP